MSQENKAKLPLVIGVDRIKTFPGMGIEFVHPCEEPGCDKEAMQCHLLDYGDFTEPAVDVFNYYCVEHATRNGYCWICGEFWAGNEEFDFEPSHLCPNCKNEVDADVVEIDPEEAGWFDEGP